MTEENKQSSRLDQGASKLHEGAAKLDEGAGNLHEGATALHEVATQLADEHRSHGPAQGTGKAALRFRGAGQITLQAARTRAARLGNWASKTSTPAIEMARRHPVAGLATVGLAASFIKVELAVGLLAGVAAAAFLVSKPGSEVRQRVASNGRLALERARDAWQSRRGSSAEPATIPLA